jgi:deoxyribodipyrimidine photolyase
MIKPEDLKNMTSAQRNALKKAELQARQKMQMSKKATPTPKAKPSPSPSTFAQRSAAAEAELRKLMKAGAVKNLNKTRDMIAKKYGVSPNGYTN